MIELKTCQFRGKREFQEDHVSVDPQNQTMAIADGFGGPGAGDKAAKMVCETALDFLAKEAGDEEATLPFELRKYYSLAGNVLFNSMILANRKLMGEQTSLSSNQSGGASLLVAHLNEDLLSVASVGSTGLAILRDGRMSFGIVPNSLNRVNDPFFFPESLGEKEDFPLVALGTSEDLQPEMCEARVRLGDWIVAFTDGVRFSALEAIRGAQIASGAAISGPSIPLEEILSGIEFEDNASLLLGKVV